MTQFYPLAKRKLQASTSLVCRLTFLFLFGLLAVSASAQTKRYVNASAATSGDGLTWATAYKDLQAALDMAVSGDEIWVAKGIYKPSKDISGSATPGDLRTKTFFLKNGIKIYGGFAGTESTLTARNIGANKTILSGDIDNNDVGDFSGNGNNSYHVVVANLLSATTILDGFTIRGGNANYATSFLGNSFGHQSGGGLFSMATSTWLNVSNCVFTANYAGFYGGGAYAYESSTRFTNCVFTNNKSFSAGGGFAGGSTGSSKFYNCVFVNNTADQGGAIYLINPGAEIINTTIVKNHAASNGGAYASYNTYGNVKITNSIMWGNTSAGSPSIYLSGTSNMSVSYSDIQGGYTAVGMMDVDPAFFKFTDPDGDDNIWMTADDGLHLSTVSPVADKGRNADIAAGVTTDIVGSLRTQNTTVNMGAYEDQYARVPVKIYVNASAVSGGNGSSWAAAYKELQAALDVAESGDEIWVAKGTYKPTKDASGNVTSDSRLRTFAIKNGIKLYGGFAGGETTLSSRNIKANVTTLSGDINGNDLPGFSGYGENSYHVLYSSGLTIATTLDGFTITAGNANDFSTSHYGYGGGLYLTNSGDGLKSTHLSITNCNFTANYAVHGGAMYMRGSATISFSVFGNNKSQGHGGALYIANGSNPTKPTIINTVFSGNIATYRGGAMYLDYGDNTTILNCTITGNTSNGTTAGTDGGGGIYSYNSPGVTVRNTIIWGNTGYYPVGIGTYMISPSVTYSNIQEAYSGTGNINVNPAFSKSTDPDGADNIWGTADDGLHLRTASPSANKGNNGDVPAGVTTDFIGAARIQNTTVNMGAYESLTPPATIYVNSSATSAGDGTTWGTAYKDLQAALDAAGNGDQIWVAKGTYKPSKDASGSATPSDSRTKTFSLKNGVNVYGGFAGGEATLGARNVTTNKTILSGDLSGNDGTGFSGYGENSYHVVYSSGLTAASILDGFTISGGNANNHSGGNAYGAGLYLTNSGDGLKSTYLSIANCIFSANTGIYGAGMYMGGSANITNSVFSNNKADSYGGGLYASNNGNPTTPTIVNTVFTGNTALYKGGGLYLDYADKISIINCTIINNGCGNTATDGGGGILHQSGIGVTIKNTIVWGNTGTSPGMAAYVTVPAVTYSNIQGFVYSGAGNLSVDPAFDKVTDPDGSDDIWGTADDGLHLGTTSPSADKGNNADVPAGITTDVTGAARIQNSTVNMGAYESVKIAQVITGLSTAETKTYGDAVYTLNATGGASGNPIVYTSSNTAVATVSGNIVTIVGAGTATITATQAGNATYGAGLATQALTVNKRAITVMPIATKKVYGDADPELTYTITSGSLVGSDAFSGSLTREVGENVGAYSIFKGTLALSSNYTLNYTHNGFNIEKRAITVTADAQTKEYGDVDPTLTYKITSGTLKTGDAFTGSLTRAAGESVNFYWITKGTLALNSNYTLTYIDAKLTITKRAITVTADAVSKTYGTGDPALTYKVTSGALLSGDAFTGSLTRTTGESVGTYTINQGTLALNANYTITYASNDLTINKRAVAVKADAFSITYGDAEPTLTYKITSGSLKSGEDFTGTLSRATGDNVGTYAINQGSLALTSNYDLTFTGNTLTIGKRAITVKADALSKEYGDTDPALTYTITAGSLVGTDKFTGSLTRASGENGGYLYAILQGTLALNSNYNLTYVSEWLTINKRAITVTADAKSKTYGDADPSFTYTVTSGSLKSGDSFTGTLSRASGTNAGTYAITIGTLAINSNYAITFVSKNLTIDKRAVTVTANKQGKVYGNTDPTITYTVAPALLSSDAFTGSLGRTPGEVVGTYAITIGTLNNNNYSITLVSNDFTIEKRVVTVTADALSKTYGNADPSLTYKVTTGSLYAGDAFSGSLIRATGENAGTYAINQGTLALSSNYTLNYVSKDFTINKRAVAIKADALGKTYGDADPALTYTLTSGTLKSGDAFTGSLTRAVGENVGTYAINQGSLVLNSNYDLVFTASSFTISKRAITVTVDAVSKTYGEVDPSLTYKLTAGTLKSGDAFSGTLSRAVGENAGTYAISQNTLAVNGNYTITFVPNNLTISKRTIAIKADALGKTYGDADPALTYTITSGTLKSGDAFTGGLARATGENVGTYAISQGTLALNSNYTINYTGATLTIDKRTITVTADAVSKTYGDDDPALTYKVPAGSLVNSDVLSGNLIRTVGEDVGTYTIIVGTLKNNNYNINFVPNSLTITTRALTIKAADASKSVSQTKTFTGTEYTITAGSLAAGDAITGVTLNSAGAASGAAVGTYTIVPSAVAGITASNYAITYVNGTLTVTAKPVLTVKATDATKVYGAANPAFTYTITGFVDGDNQATATTGAPELTTSVTTTSPAGTYSGVITAAIGTLASSKYEFSFVNGSITVDKKAITVTADAQTKEYGDADPALTYTITSGALVGTDAFSGNLDRTTGESIGTYAINKGTLSVSSNYIVTFVPNDLTIAKRNVTVTADALSKVYGGLDPTLTYKVTAGSLKSGDAFTGSLTRVAGEDAGSYAINQGTLALNSNYNLTYVSKNLTIGKRFITITADAVGKVYGDADPAFTYTVSSGALKAGDVLAGSLTRTSGENVGTYAIAIGTLNNNNYNINFVSNNLTISKRAITIAAEAKSKVYGDVDPALTYKLTAGTLKSGDVLAGSLTRAVGENVGAYTIGKGTLNNSNYDITFVTNNLTINKKTITVIVDAQSKIYGDADPALTYTATPALVGSDAFSGSLTRATGENAGTYAINIGTLSASSNYDVTLVPDNLTISKRDITVTADAVSKTYGDVDPALTYAITSGALVSGDAFTGSLDRVAGENAGTYTINKGTLALNSNYNLAFVSDNLTIGKRAITVSAAAQSKVYGDADPVLTYTITSGALVSSDVLTGSLERAAGEDAGSYNINIGTLNNANYNITFVSNDLAIDKRAISVTADAQGKVYGDADPALTYAITSGSLVGSDAFTGSLSRVTGENVGTYAINQNTLALSANYTLSFTGADLTIDKRAITIKATDASKAEGQTKTFAGTEYSISAGSLASGDAITSVTLNSAGTAAGAAVGTYDIVPSNAVGITDNNYTITYVNGTLTVNPCAGVTITTQPVAQVKCAGADVTFEVVATGTGLTYQWYKGSDPITNATAATYTIAGVTPAHAGDYRVEVMGCIGVTSNTVSLTVNTVATPTITASGNVLTSSATTGNQWYLEGAEITGATAQTYEVQAAGRYRVKASSGSCSATSAEFNFIPTRIDGPGAWNGEVVAYPNPVGKTLYIKNNSSRKLQLKLVDVAGVSVRTSTLVGTQGSIHVEGLASGAYYLVITDQQNKQTVSFKLIKL